MLPRFRVHPAAEASNREVPASGGVGRVRERGTAMELQAKIQEAMKARDDLARDLLRVILGEVSTRKARTGKEPRDEEIHAIIRSVMANNQQTRAELEQRGQTGHGAYARLAREHAYLETLLPRTLDQAAIAKE